MLSLNHAKNLSFADGTITKSIEKKKFLDLDTMNSMLLSWMLHNMDSKIASSIPYYEIAKTL